MKRFLFMITALLALSVPARASIARGGSCSGTTSCTPSSSVAFQVEFAYAYNGASTTIPSLPAGWFSVVTKTGTTSAARVACRVEFTSTAAASGTFTNATNTGIVGYTGTGARAGRDCVTVGVAVGGNTPNNGTSNTPSYNTVTMTNSSGSSWVLGLLGDGTSGNICTPSGMSNVAAATTGDVSFNDTNGGVTGWTTTTCTTGSSVKWITVTLEILAPLTAPPTLTQLVNGDGGMGIYTGAANAGNNFRRKLDATLSGNIIIGSLIYDRSATRTLSITTDKGDSATITTCDDSGNSLTGATYFIYPTVGSTLLTFTFDATVLNFQEAHHQFSGIASSSPTDGTASCNINTTPANNNLGNLADATGVTTATDGDMIYSTAFDEGFVNGQANTVDDIIFASGFTGLYAEPWFAAAAEAEIQSTHGLIKPSFTFIQATNENFMLMTTAFKTASTGTARQSGKIVRTSEGYINSGSGSATQPFLFPCDTGNFINFSFENNSGVSGANVTALVDAQGNTWTSYNPGGTNYPQYWNATNATCNGQGFGEVTFTRGVGATRLTIYELSNALTSSPVDTSANTSAALTVAAATTLAANVTSAGQTSFSLTAAGGIANGDFLMVSTEVVKVTAGGGTTTLTVSRGQFGTTALASITSGTNVIESLNTGLPTITPSQANEAIFCSMNQGIGPNWDANNATFDFGAAPGQADNTSTYANGDGNCHVYAPTTSAINIGWFISNGGSTTTGFTSAIAVKLQSTAPTVVNKRAKLDRMDP